MATEITVWFGFWLESWRRGTAERPVRNVKQIRGLKLGDFVYSSSSSSSSSSSFSSSSSSSSSTSSGGASPPSSSSGVSGSPAFLPGRSPNHLGRRALGLLVQSSYFLPHGLKVLSSDDLPATFVQLLSVVVGSGVGTSLVLGVHTDLGWVLASESLGVETLLEGLPSELNLLSLLEFLEFVVLGHTSLLKVVFVSLKLNNDVEEILSFSLELIRVHGVEVPH